MCDANTSMAAQGLGAGVSTVGSYYSALGQKTSLNAQAGLATIDARLANDEGDAALQQGQFNQQQALLEGAQTKSTQRADMAANGVDLGVGSALNVQDSTDLVAQVNAKNANLNALRTAFGYRAQAVQDTNKALMDKAQASGISPWMAGGGTLLTSAKSIATSRYELQKSGGIDANGNAVKTPGASWW